MFVYILSHDTFENVTHLIVIIIMADVLVAVITYVNSPQYGFFYVNDND